MIGTRKEAQNRTTEGKDLGEFIKIWEYSRWKKLKDKYSLSDDSSVAEFLLNL